MNKELIEAVGRVAHLQKQVPRPLYVYGDAGDEFGPTYHIVPQKGPTDEEGNYNDLANTGENAGAADFFAAAGSLPFADLYTALLAATPTSLSSGGGAGPDAFEQWAAPLFDIRRHADGYASAGTNDAWLAWQAAAARVGSPLGGGAASYKGLTQFYFAEDGYTKSYDYVAPVRYGCHIIKQQSDDEPRLVHSNDLDRACSTEEGAWAMMALKLEEDAQFIKENILPQFRAALSEKEESSQKGGMDAA